MTDKKEQILSTALELFANEGYASTSTSKIAKQAKVSEGLIFKHFENKKGLLCAIIKEAENKIGQVLAPILFEDQPKNVLRNLLNMLFTMPEEEYDFWRLQFKLKWDIEYYNPDKMKPLLDKLEWVFEKLGYEAPSAEAQLFSNLVDAIAVSILRDGKEKQLPIKQLLFKKYQL